MFFSDLWPICPRLPKDPIDCLLWISICDYVRYVRLLGQVGISGRLLERKECVIFVRTTNLEKSSCLFLVFWMLLIKAILLGSFINLMSLVLSNLAGCRIGILNFMFQSLDNPPIGLLSSP